MKKITALLVLMISLILVGCQSKPEALGIIEVDIEQVDQRLQEVITPDYKLLVANDTDSTYTRSY